MSAREKPILFSGPMVQAILEGRKAQTRRVITPEWSRCLDLDDEDDRAAALAQAPYRAGDTLWVRETWRTEELADGLDGVRFRADDAFVPISATRVMAEWWIRAHRGGAAPSLWRPSIHMPRWASRLTLRVLDVRVERLQAITESDARAEGCFPEPILSARGGATTAGLEFELLWNSINGKRPGASWEANPWVWVVSFERPPEVPS